MIKTIEQTIEEEDKHRKTILLAITKPIIKCLKKQGYTIMDEDTDDGEYRIVYHKKDNKKVTIELMYQETYD